MMRNPESPYWQHREPLACPNEHEMIWLGSAYWICESCHTIYAETPTKGKESRR